MKPKRRRGNHNHGRFPKLSITFRRLSRASHGFHQHLEAPICPTQPKDLSSMTPNLPYSALVQKWEEIQREMERSIKNCVSSLLKVFIAVKKCQSLIRDRRAHF